MPRPEIGALPGPTLTTLRRQTQRLGTKTEALAFPEASTAGLSGEAAYLSLSRADPFKLGRRNQSARSQVAAHRLIRTLDMPIAWAAQKQLLGIG